MRHVVFSVVLFIVVGLVLLWGFRNGDFYIDDECKQIIAYLENYKQLEYEFGAILKISEHIVGSVKSNTDGNIHGKYVFEVLGSNKKGTVCVEFHLEGAIVKVDQVEIQ